MRAISTAAVLALVASCGPGPRRGDDDPGPGDAGCTGEQCLSCAAQGKPETAITGNIYAPNGTMPLYGIDVYVPRRAPEPFVEGAQCTRCTDELPGDPISHTRSDELGFFKLENIPVGDNVPLVITAGKWRRQLVIPRVEACAVTTLSAEQTRLPRDRSEGDIPRIAITTGDADLLECLVRKLGVSDAEFTTHTGPGRIHLFRGNGVDAFASGHAGGAGPLPSAVPLWNDAANLAAYDMVFLSCESRQQGPLTQKTQASLDAMKAYADLGGRVFASHWHNIWVGGNFLDNNPALRPAVWDTIATWRSDGFGTPLADQIDEVSNPKGAAFATWLMAVTGSTMRGVIPLRSGTGRESVRSLDLTRAERWVHTRDTSMSPQMFLFTTPNEAPPQDRCGKVVFTDMHVSGTPNLPIAPFPAHCTGGDMTPQEKALAFIFFDIATCVGPIF